jgi:hypothetical protein
MVSPLGIQVWGGVLLAFILLFQVATGFRWLKLGKKRVKYHRRAGVVMAVLAAVHAYLGFALLYALFPFG